MTIGNLENRFENAFRNSLGQEILPGDEVIFITVTNNKLRVRHGVVRKTSGAGQVSILERVVQKYRKWHGGDEGERIYLAPVTIWSGRVFLRGTSLDDLLLYKD